VGGVLIKSSKALGVHHQNGTRLAVASLPLEGPTPHPQTLRTRVDGGSHSESVGAVEYHTVEEVGFPCSVHACNSHYADGGWEGLNELEGVVVHGVLLLFWVVLDERDGFIPVGALGVHVFEFILND
jgi:hypothetical protein